jgi:hypothetical protein
MRPLSKKSQTEATAKPLKATAALSQVCNMASIQCRHLFVKINDILRLKAKKYYLPAIDVGKYTDSTV